MRGIICWILLNISHFSSTACTAAMAKRAQQGSEERVTAKSRPMMNLTARMPSVVSPSTSSNPGRTSYGYQDPGKSVASDDRSGKPEKPYPPPGCSKEDYGQSWSSQEWKSGAAEHDRSRKPEKTSWDMLQQVAPHREEPLLDGNAHSVRYGETIHDGSGKPETLNLQEEANSENFVMGSDATEFVDKVKDLVRNRQKRMSNVAHSWERISQLFKVSSRIMKISRWNRCSMSPRSWWITRRKSMAWTKFIGERIHGDNCHWLVMKQLSIFKAKKSYVFSDSVLCLGRVLQHLDSNEGWKNRIAGIQSGKSYRDYDGINGEPTESEWNIFPGFTTLQFCGKINDLLSDLGQTPETFTGRIFFQCSMTSLVTEKATKMHVWQMSDSSKYLRGNLVLDNGHLLDQVLKRSGILQRTVHEGLGIILRKKCYGNSQKADILLSVQRLHCPGVFSKAKDMENCRYTSLQMN